MEVEWHLWLFPNAQGVFPLDAQTNLMDWPYYLDPMNRAGGGRLDGERERHGLMVWWAVTDGAFSSHPSTPRRTLDVPLDAGCCPEARRTLDVAPRRQPSTLDVPTTLCRPSTPRRLPLDVPSTYPRRTPLPLTPRAQTVGHNPNKCSSVREIAIAGAPERRH